MKFVKLFVLVFLAVYASISASVFIEDPVSAHFRVALNEGGANPDEGGANPDEGGANPDEGGANPDEGGTNPDEGGTNPDEGGTNPDEGGTNPDEGGTNPDEEQPNVNNNDSITSVCSQTLPIIFITTEDSVPITSKEEYLNATYYVNTLGIEGYDSIGSFAEQLPMEIRGRGNASWLMDKKPYRIKLGAKQEFLGMNKSKHFALLAKEGAYAGHINEMAAFELGKIIGLPWSPAIEPVEVVLNGEYLGLYFLTETVRVDEDRVNIFEQPDECEDPELIKGGWLVEIDNYEDVNQIVFEEEPGVQVRITAKTPDVMSPMQNEYLLNEFMTMNEAIHREDKSDTQWEDYIDIDNLARYYIVSELFDNIDAFSGSCYLYKDLGDSCKWSFGPFWDMDGSFPRIKDCFLYVDKPHRPKWIAEIAKFPNFQAKVREIWDWFYPVEFEKIFPIAESFAQKISGATLYNHKVWPQYGSTEAISKYRWFKGRITAAAVWLEEQWSVPFTTGVSDVMTRGGFDVKCDDGRVVVETWDNSAIKSVEAINLQGVSSRFNNVHTLYEANLSSGFYVLVLHTNSGQKLVEKLFVK